MSKKVYRSLFDSDDVYEVEELSDCPTLSTEGIAQVKAEDSGNGFEERLKKVEDAIGEIRDALKTRKDSEQPDNIGGSTPGNTPAGEMVVEKVDPVIDADGTEEEDEDSEGKKKGVKDAYSTFAQGLSEKKGDGITATQSAFQKRYEKVANR